jgi:hypothetical protein
LVHLGGWPKEGKAEPAFPISWNKNVDEIAGKFGRSARCIISGLPIVKGPMKEKWSKDLYWERVPWFTRSKFIEGKWK